MLQYLPLFPEQVPVTLQSFPSNQLNISGLLVPSPLPAAQLYCHNVSLCITFSRYLVPCVIRGFITEKGVTVEESLVRSESTTED